MRPDFAGLLVCFTFSLTFGLQVSAQQASTLAGTVVDATDAVIPGATVTLTSKATAAPQISITDGSGAFHFSGLKPGTYQLLVECLGFKTALRSDIEVASSDASQVKITLQIGDLSETVEVFQPSVDELIEQLEQKDSSTLRGAISELADLGPGASESVPGLARLLSSDAPIRTKKAAIEALLRIAPESGQTVDALVRVLKAADRGKEDMELAQMAAVGLGLIGEPARRSVADLILALPKNQADEDEEFKATICWALGQMGPDRLALTTLVGLLKQRAQKNRDLIEVRQEDPLFEVLYFDFVIISAINQIAYAAQDQRATDLIAPLEEALHQIEAYQKTLAKDIQGPDLDLIPPYISAAVPSSVGFSEDILSSKGLLGDEVRRAREFLENLWWFQLKEQILKLPASARNAILAYAALLLVWSLLYWTAPLTLLSAERIAKPLGAIQIASFRLSAPLEYLTLLRVFLYRSRVLDAWVKRHFDAAAQAFLSNKTVADRKVHVEMPVIVNGKARPALTSSGLRRFFSKTRCTLLIWGEGGAGKTSLACEIGRWAMAKDPSSRICEHLMLPVLLEDDLAERPEGEQPRGEDLFIERIHGLLNAAIGGRDPIPSEMLYHLLTRGRVLVIVDSFSERDDLTRRAIRFSDPSFPAKRLIVTSRLQEPLGRIPRQIIQPTRLQANRLSMFMHAYLSQRGKRDSFNDKEYFAACARLTEMVRDREITAMLAKLFAEQLIAFKESSEAGELPENIPELMLHYVNNLNRDRTENDPDDRTIHRALKAIAWECLKQGYRPTRALRDEVLAALGSGQKAPAQLDYLEQRLKIVETVGAGRNHLKISLDPLAEYMAGLHLVESLREDQARWHEFLEGVRLSADRGSMKGFLLALRDCCLVKESEFQVPGFVSQQLAQLAYSRDGEGRRVA